MRHVRRSTSRQFLVLLVIGLFQPALASATTCEGLAAMTISHIEIRSATMIAAGRFTPAQPSERSEAAGLSGSVPAFCRVVGVARPTTDSVINFEVWLPAVSSWNRKFEGVGNGGYIGSISYGAMENAISRGYATASTDTGHAGGDLRFAAGHPEKIVDWGYCAIHITAQAAKLILREYYGHSPQHSYFNGCSTGGEQALSEAQRFPEDYDGILAGDAGNDRVHLNVGFLWAFAVTHKDGQPILPEAKLPLINKAAIAACDKDDGLEDGVIADPLHCAFDPGTLLCKAGESEGCLTSTEVEAVRKIYQGPKNPRTGKRIIAGWEPGSEVLTSGDYGGWKNYVLSGSEPARTDFWKYFVFDDPHWDWRTFDYDRDVAYADTKMAAVNASGVDLQKYKALGGKILMYHGWADPVGPPQDAIDYYERVEQAMGGSEKTHDFFRLFLAPGMSHCNGGPGYQLAGGARAGNDPDNVPKSTHPDPGHDMLSALDRWVEQNNPPDRIIATRHVPGADDHSMPVCAYPLTAHLLKGGDAKNASGFGCIEQKPARGKKLPSP